MCNFLLLEILQINFQLIEYIMCENILNGEILYSIPIIII